jgi:CRISP-associated protein Cas1
MKMILLNGHGMNIKVDGAKLYIKDGKYEDDVEPETYRFSPKRINVDNIVIYGRTGSLSIESIKWLMKHDVTITILNWNGKLLTTIMPPESVQVKTKFAQYSSYRDEKLRLEISKKLIKAKFERTKIILDWLKLRYPETEYDFSKEEQKLSEAKTINEIMLSEARVGGMYWKKIIKVLPQKYEFETRKTNKQRFGAGDIVNCMLNYGYAILEAECLRAIHSAGLDAHVGFLHEMNLGKNSLAYDLQEPFRFLIDLAVVSIIEKGEINKRDFIRTENYNLRLRPSGAKKLLKEISVWLNRKVNYDGQKCKWSYVMLTQTRDLAYYLLGKKKTLNLSEPSFEIERDDTDEIRKIISEMSYTKWNGLDFSKGTLHPLKQKVKEGQAFTLNQHVKERLLELK